MTGEHFTRTYYGTAGICSAFVAAVFTTWMFNRISQWKSGYRKEDFEINDVYLVQLVQDNIDAVKLGKEPVEIINKVFLDSISDIGGAGATLALVIAILRVSKNRSTKKVAGYGIIPSIAGAQPFDWLCGNSYRSYASGDTAIRLDYTTNSKRLFDDQKHQWSDYASGFDCNRCVDLYSVCEKDG